VRIVADRELCVGAGQCVLTEPQLFEQSDEDGRVRLLAEQPAADQTESARLATRLCPTRALSVLEM
jgi:ferredoxin